MKYFGTDGIRGIPNKTLTNELVYKIGKSLSTLGNKRVYVAFDTRISKDMLFCSLASGCMSMGLDVYNLGVLSTPGLIYYSKQKNAIGVMITASHNPYTDNGIKIVLNGRKLNESEEKKIEKYIENPVDFSNSIGRLFYDRQARNEYINFILSKVQKSNFRIGIDCANGATYELSQMIFPRLAKEVKFIGCEPDGFNINQQVGSTNIYRLKELVLLNKLDFGFAFDGDGDRVIAVDFNGNVIDGDKIIYILASYLKRQDKLKNNKVCLTVMSDLGVIKALNEIGVSVNEVNVGDKYVYKNIVENDLSLGGENSGHIILFDQLNTGDGVLIASILIEIFRKEEKIFQDYLKDINSYFSRTINLSIENKNNLIKNEMLINKIDKIKNKFNQECKVIVRLSGTENLVRVTLMGKEEKKVNFYINELVEFIKEIE